MVMAMTSAFGICYIQNGYCEVGGGKNPALQDKYVPNRLKQITEPTAFQAEFIKPYDDALINTDEPTMEDITPQYNANCQFGTCLPGEVPNQSPFNR